MIVIVLQDDSKEHKQAETVLLEIFNTEVIYQQSNCGCIYFSKVDNDLHLGPTANPNTSVQLSQAQASEKINSNVTRLRIDKRSVRQKSKEFELDRDLVTPPKSFKFGYPTKFGYTI